jgi:hypothetical protein
MLYVADATRGTKKEKKKEDTTSSLESIER